MVLAPTAAGGTLLTAKETILLVIQGGSATVSDISVKLRDLGVKWKPAENEVRARLSELRRLQMVQGGMEGRPDLVGNRTMARRRRPRSRLNCTMRTWSCSANETSEPP